MEFGIEQIRQSVLRIILRRQIAMLFWTVRGPAFARVVDPAHDVIVIGLLTDLRKVRGECAAKSLVFFADRMASHTATRFEQFFAVILLALRLRGGFAVKAVLPEVSSHRLQIV